MANKKVAFCTLGCKVNQYETNAMMQEFLKRDYKIVEFDEKADIYIVNTCTVTNMADRKSRQMLRRVKELNPNSILVACGCYAQVAKEELSNIPEIDLILGNNEKNNIVQYIENKMNEANNSHKDYITDVLHSEEYSEWGDVDFTEKTRAVIKVQDGCDRFCSYCIIPYARGRIRSRKAEEVVHEVETLAANGCKEVVLTGIHLSSYGLDHGDNLLHLIQEVHKVEGIRRIRLGSLEPGIIDENFVKELAKLEKICPHFHLSLQSGCDATLKRMNRKYDTATYEAGCKLIRKYFTHPAITTDVIVGFPGETEEEFEATKEFLERIHFYEMHIFKYSKRKGTKAAVMPDQVPEQVKTERSKVLLALAQEMSEEFREYYVGRPEEILLEETDEIAGNVYFTGYTKEYVKIAVPEAEGEENILVKGVVTGRISADVYRMENIEKAE